MKRFYCAVLFSLIFCASALYAIDTPERVVRNPWIILRSFMTAYPDKITALEYDNEIHQWYLMVSGTAVYWAEGRLLPRDLVESWSSWRSYVDYLYPHDIPDPSTFSPELIERLSHKVLAERRKNATVYHPFFYGLLYGGTTRRHIEEHIRRFDYLGLRVSVHRDLVGKLQKIETRLTEMASTDAEVQNFLDSLISIEGYNWRDIRDSANRSNHSWGIAIDMLPRNWGKKNIYWNWISYWNDKWMLIPPDRRWMPPLSVIRVFESEGFIWGGKWILWDTMHFEYRPELLVLREWGYSGL